jgi:hypothetical protein
MVPNRMPPTPLIRAWMDQVDHITLMNQLTRLASGMDHLSDSLHKTCQKVPLLRSMLSCGVGAVERATGLTFTTQSMLQTLTGSLSVPKGAQAEDNKLYRWSIRCLQAQPRPCVSISDTREVKVHALRVTGTMLMTSCSLFHQRHRLFRRHLPQQ